jgi:hypothetical protein
MEFLLLMSHRKDDESGDDVSMAQMGKFMGSLAKSGKLLNAGPLHSEDSGVRVRVRGGRASVTDGPFAESKEVVGGYILVRASSRAAAIELAKECPHARSGFVEVRQAGCDRAEEPAKGVQWMLLLLDDERAAAMDGQKQFEAMTAYDDALKKEGRYVECAGLPREVPGARVEVRKGKARVFDGPFAESKEIVGGYVVFTARTRAEAIELAKRCPSAEWCGVELRELVSVGEPG